MTVAELIEHLRTLPPELPVYDIDHDRHWVALNASDVCCSHFSRMGWSYIRAADFYITVEDNFNPPNGVGIGI